MMEHARLYYLINLCLLLFSPFSQAADYAEAYRNAIDADQPEMIEQLLQLGMDINTKMPARAHEPPVLHAINKSHYALARFLIAHGADVDLTDDDGYTALAILLQFPLKEAQPQQFAEAAKTLDLILTHTADINHLQGNKAGYGTPALTLAVDYGIGMPSGTDQVWLVDKILHHKPDINLMDYEGKSPMVHAILNNDAVIVQRLLQSGANPNEQDAAGTTLLMFSASRGQLPIVKLLVQAGANIAPKDNDRGESLLSLAAQSGNIELVKYLRTIMSH